MPNKPISGPLPTGMAYRYECAWNKVVMDCSSWKREQIIQDPFGRHAVAAAHEAAQLAERDNEPILTGLNNNPAAT